MSFLFDGQVSVDGGGGWGVGVHGGGLARRQTSVAVRGAAGCAVWIIEEYSDEFITPECLNGADSPSAQI